MTPPLHGSCVAYGNHGALIIGAPGSGKSGLTLQLMAFGATLVADDRVSLSSIDGRLRATCPPTIAGMIEARHIGLLKAPAQASTYITCVVDMGRTEPDRLPPHRTHTIMGVAIDLIFGKDTPNLAPALTFLLQSGRIA